MQQMKLFVLSFFYTPQAAACALYISVCTAALHAQARTAELFLPCSIPRALRAVFLAGI